MPGEASRELVPGNPGPLPFSSFFQRPLTTPLSGGSLLPQMPNLPQETVSPERFTQRDRG